MSVPQPHEPTSYDSVPYESKSFVETHPDHLVDGEKLLHVLEGYVSGEKPNLPIGEQHIVSFCVSISVSLRLLYLTGACVHHKIM
jgi:hypothetical protein